MNKLIPTCFLLLTMALFVGCNAYEDGPLISLRSKEKRIVGKKKITLYEINGIDSLSKIEAAFATSSYDSSGFDWEYEVDDSKIGCTSGCITGYWELQERNKILHLSLPAPWYTGDVFPTGDWTILRMTLDELWLTMNKNNINYEIRFERIE